MADTDEQSEQSCDEESRTEDSSSSPEDDGISNTNRPQASFSMAHVLSMVRQRQERQQREREEEAKRIEEERKQKAREKSRRRRQKQKERKAKLKAEIDASQHDQASDLGDRGSKSGDLKRSLSDDDEVDDDNDDDDCQGDRSEKPKLKKLKSGEANLPSLDQQETQIGNEANAAHKKLISLVPRALLVKRKGCQ